MGMVRLLDLQLLYGVAGAREQFEKLCGQLISSQYPGTRGVRSERGDGGVDFFVGDQTDSSGITVFQVKYFPSGLKDSQKQQIRESFRQCRENTSFALKEWILCVPLDLSPDEIMWFSQWSAGVAPALLPPAQMDWWGETKLGHLLLSPENSGIKERFFPEEHLHRLAEIQDTLANLIDDLHARLPQHDFAHLALERNAYELKAHRRQICVPLLTSLHELAPIRATFRKVHDSLWERQKFNFQARTYRKQQIASFFKTAQERATTAGSELSIDPGGEKVLAAFTTFLQVQADYFQMMTEAMGFQSLFLGKVDKGILDEFEKKMDQELTALEEAIRLYVDTPSGFDQLVVGAQQSDPVEARRGVSEEHSHDGV